MNNKIVMEIIDYIKPSKIERDKIIIKDEETIKKYNELIPNFKMCVKCESLGTVDKYYTDRNGKITKNCLVCRDKQKKLDHKRDNEHVKELARKNAQKQERKEQKKQYRQNHKEQHAKYYLKYRKNQLENNVEEYRKRNNKNMAEWRKNNPEKVIKINKQTRENKNKAYTILQNIANNKNLEINITKENFYELIDKECYFCGSIDEKGFNGIDRDDCTKGYTLDNVNTCCETCNFIKGNMNTYTFMLKIKHILKYNEYNNDGELNYELFNDYGGTSFSRYTKRSIEKFNVEPEFTEENFIELINEKCYICGKETNEFHKMVLTDVITISAIQLKTAMHVVEIVIL